MLNEVINEKILNNTEHIPGTYQNIYVNLQPSHIPSKEENRFLKSQYWAQCRMSLKIVCLSPFSERVPAGSLICELNLMPAPQVSTLILANEPFFTLNLELLYEYVLSCVSHVWRFVTPWTLAHQAPLSMGFSRQEYWSGLPGPPPGNFPYPGIEPTFPALTEDTLPPASPGKPLYVAGTLIFVVVTQGTPLDHLVRWVCVLGPVWL